MKNIILNSIACVCAIALLVSCSDETSPVSPEPVAIDSTPAPAGRLVFVRDGKRFESDMHFKDSLGVHQGAYAFYQISSQELSIYGRRAGEKPEVIFLTTKVPVKKQAPFAVADYTIEFQEGIILNSKTFQTDSIHFGSYSISKFNLGDGLVSGSFATPLTQVFPINENKKMKVEYGSFIDLPMIIMD